VIIVLFAVVPCFARQVRSAGSWAGNISIAKQHPLFPSDLVTMFSAYGAQIDW
jgi:CO/xanthine dehydrogenase FAD-binding subunit